VIAVIGAYKATRDPAGARQYGTASIVFSVLSIVILVVLVIVTIAGGVNYKHIIDQIQVRD